MRGPDAVAARRLLLGVCVVATACLAVLQCARFGIGLSPDSAEYLVAAEHLAEGGGLLGLDGPFVKWPPLLPVILALLASMGLGAGDAALGLNVLCLVATVLLAVPLLDRSVPQVVLRFVGVLAIAGSPVLLDVAAWLWSETLFIALATGVLACIAADVERRRSWWLLAGLCAAAALTRYIGVLLPLVAACMVCVFGPGTRWRRIPAAVQLSGLALLPLALWMLRNLLVSGTPTGERWPSDVAFGGAVCDGLITLGDWVFPRVLPGWLRLAAPLLVIAVVAARVVELLARREEPRNVGEARTLLALLVFVVGFVTVLALLAARVAFDPIGDRLLAPVYVPFLALALAAVGQLTRWAAALLQLDEHLPLSCAIAVMVGWLIYHPLARSLDAVEQRRTNGAGGYATVFWQHNVLVDALRESELDGVVYSNSPQALRVLVGREARSVPRRHGYRTPAAGAEPIAGSLCACEPGVPVYLVWFEGRGDPAHLHPLAALAREFSLARVRTTNAGAVFEVVDAPRCEPRL